MAALDTMLNGTKYPAEKYKAENYTGPEFCNDVRRGAVFVNNTYFGIVRVKYIDYVVICPTCDSGRVSFVRVGCRPDDAVCALATNYVRYLVKNNGGAVDSGIVNIALYTEYASDVKCDYIEWLFVSKKDDRFKQLFKTRIIKKIEQLMQEVEQGLADKEEMDKTCLICLDTLNTECTTRPLRCNHYFHTVCITSWVPISNTCPKCKKQVLLSNN